MPFSSYSWQLQSHFIFLFGFSAEEAYLTPIIVPMILKLLVNKIPNMLLHILSTILFSMPRNKVTANITVVIIPTPEITHKETLTIDSMSWFWVRFWSKSKSFTAASLAFSASSLDLTAWYSDFSALFKAFFNS